MTRKPRTSVRVFSKLVFTKCNNKEHLLVGVHKNKRLAEKQREKIGNYRLESSCINKKGKGYGLFVRWK